MSDDPSGTKACYKTPAAYFTWDIAWVGFGGAPSSWFAEERYLDGGSISWRLGPVRVGRWIGWR